MRSVLHLLSFNWEASGISHNLVINPQPFACCICVSPLQAVILYARQKAADIQPVQELVQALKVHTPMRLISFGCAARCGGWVRAAGHRGQRHLLAGVDALSYLLVASGEVTIVDSVLGCSSWAGVCSIIPAPGLLSFLCTLSPVRSLSRAWDLRLAPTPNEIPSDS